MAVTTPAQYIWRVGDISSWSKYSPGEIHGMCRTAILISYSRACSSCRARSKPESWPSDGLPFGLTNHDDGEGEVAGFKGERPIVFTFLGERWGGGAGGRSFQRQFAPARIEFVQAAQLIDADLRRHIGEIALGPGKQDVDLPLRVALDAVKAVLFEQFRRSGILRGNRAAFDAGHVLVGMKAEHH